MRVVLDTNILVSALLWRGTPYRCLLAVQTGLADLILSPLILADLIVSGDRHLLELGSAAGVPVITAREFLHQLGGV